MMKLNKDTELDFIQEFKTQNFSIKETLEVLGIKRNTYNSYRQKNDDFKLLLEEAKIPPTPSSFSTTVITTTTTSKSKHNYSTVKTDIGTYIDITSLSSTEEKELFESFYLALLEANFNRSTAISMLGLHPSLAFFNVDTLECIDTKKEQNRIKSNDFTNGLKRIYQLAKKIQKDKVIECLYLSSLNGASASTKCLLESLEKERNGVPRF